MLYLRRLRPISLYILCYFFYTILYPLLFLRYTALDSDLGVLRLKKGACHKSQLNRLSRIEGQVRGLSKMIEEERYCIDIITQIKAIKSAIKSVELSIVEHHMEECVAAAVKAPDKRKREKVLKEILSLLKASSK